MVTCMDGRENNMNIVRIYDGVRPYRVIRWSETASIPPCTHTHTHIIYILVHSISFELLLPMSVRCVYFRRGECVNRRCINANIEHGEHQTRYIFGRAPCRTQLPLDVDTFYSWPQYSHAYNNNNECDDVHTHGSLFQMLYFFNHHFVWCRRTNEC